MTPPNEIKLGIGLWAVGIIGCLLTVFYVTKHEGVLYLISGCIFAIGIALTWCGAFDFFCDDFDEEIKDSYKT